MTKSALVSEDLSRVAVIAVGSATATYAREVAGDTSHSAITITRSSDIDDVVTQVADQFAASDASSRLPAVLLISDTKEADTVVAVIRALRAARLPMRPRVWPAFVSGDVSHLDNFDKVLDELGSSASDVVVIATGSGGTAATSTALRAWLHVKVPAPPSVLAELPDKSGHTCRYVAVGSITVSEATSPDITDTQADGPDVAAITVAVAKDLRACAADASVVKLAQDAANALCAAAEHFDVPALIQAESTLSQALADVERSLPAVLDDQIPSLVAARMTGPAAEIDDEPFAEPMATASTDRTELVANLAQLASKGSMARMFAKSRMTAIAEQLAVAARADVSQCTTSVVASAQTGVAPMIEREIGRIAREQSAVAEAAAIDLRDREDAAWRDKINIARQRLTIWPKVATQSIARSWGGGAPAPRQYIVTTSRSAVTLTEDDNAMAVIDLRDANPQTDSGSQRCAIILIAQYGLPLSALS